MDRVKYKLGEGIIGRVIQTGEAVAIPKISEEPLFLNRTASRKMKGMGEISFMCVPVQKGAQVVGALSVDRAYDPDYSLNDGTKLLSVVATMLARHAINLETIQLEKEALRDENKRLKDELENKYRINNIIGNSNKMREVFQMISQVSRSNATVLIRGESGTGKELVANSIHYNSKRAKMPFVKVNCAAIPNNLIESELFGHEKGAFTGAPEQKKGKFELADGGTLFLDEIGELPLNMQVKLLRALQEGTIDRIGGTRTIYLDVRIIAATNADLNAAVAEKKFREDLFFRLNVVPVELPLLSERPEDIMVLAHHFLTTEARAANQSRAAFSLSAMAALSAHPWPGNVRELQNRIRRALTIFDGQSISVSDLGLNDAEPESPTESLPTLKEARDQAERRCVRLALLHTGNNISQAAKLLAISRPTLHDLINKHGIETQ
jgi:Nif-specific regulatory protein